MTKLKHIVALAALVLGMGAASAFAQSIPGTLVQQSPTHLDSATSLSTNVTSATTLTLTPNAGESVYLYGVYISNCAGSAAVTAANPTTLTTTNLNGSPAWTIGSGVSAGLCQPEVAEVYAPGLKAAAVGTAVTFVMPTFATNQTIRLRVAWRSAS